MKEYIYGKNDYFTDSEDRKARQTAADQNFRHAADRPSEKGRQNRSKNRIIRRF